MFGGQLPANLEITWNAHLKTCAGNCTHSLWRRGTEEVYIAKVALSSKVLDSYDKLASTLCHELVSTALPPSNSLKRHCAHTPHCLSGRVGDGCGNERQCHAAQWTIDHTAKPPHGAVFQKWADAAMRAIPGMSVTTCHNYEIFKPFKFACTKCRQVRLCAVSGAPRYAALCMAEAN